MAPSTPAVRTQPNHPERGDLCGVNGHWPKGPGTKLESISTFVSFIVPFSAPEHAVAAAWKFVRESSTLAASEDIYCLI